MSPFTPPLPVRRPVVNFIEIAIEIAIEIEIEIAIAIAIETDCVWDVRTFDPDSDPDPDDIEQTPCRTLLRLFLIYCRSWEWAPPSLRDVKSSIAISSV